VADVAFGVIDERVVGTAEDAAEGVALLDVAAGGGGGVGADNVDLLGIDAGAIEGHGHATGLLHGIGKHKIAGVAVHGVAGQFAVDFGATTGGIGVALEDVEAAAFGDDDAVAVAVEGAAGERGIFVGGESALAGETGKNAEGADAFGDAAGDGNVAFAEHQHLSALDHAGVACGTGGTDGVVGAGDAHVERDLAGGVIGDGTGIVVVGPDFDVVVEGFDLVDFVFGLDVAMLGDADVDAHPSEVDVGPVEARVGDGFVGAINGDASCSCTTAELFAFLVLEFVEVALAGEGVADVADLVVIDAAFASQEGRSIVRQRIAVGGGESDAGNHDALVILNAANHGGESGWAGELENAGKTLAGVWQKGLLTNP